MLIEFSVANFRSIKERVTLSMLASDDEWLEENLIQPDGYDGRLLKSAVIYGANASGKSNVLKAMEFMVGFLVNAHRQTHGDPIYVVPFRLDSNSEQEPSEFQIIFLLDGMKYAYGFVVDDEKVHEEYLYYYPNQEQVLIFERTDATEFEFGEDEEEQKTLAKRTLDNTLYLSVATQFNYKKAVRIFEWFKGNMEFWIDPDDFQPSRYRNTGKQLFDNPELKRMMTEFIVNADLGILDIEISKEISDVETVFYKTQYKPGYAKKDVVRKKKEHYEVEFHHHGSNEDGETKRVTFSLQDESAGTQRMFEILGPWLHVLKIGKLLIVDELEKSLHPLMMEQLMKVFHDPQLNTAGAQLIFTTHNTNLLDTSIFRRDQIWLTEKNPQVGSTDLYSLDDFTPREDEDLEKGYLIGRYGAIPYFRGGSLL